MATPYAFGTPRHQEDKDQLAFVLASCFNGKPELFHERGLLVGEENIRVLHTGDTVHAGLWLLPKGQWFGGKSVPTTGIAAVGVAPEYRGRDAARTLMDEMIKEQHAQGVALSTLYPATLTLYRRSGYEIAGYAYRTKLSPGSIYMRDRDLNVRAATTGDRPAIEALYRAAAAERAGHLDRGAYAWDRIYNFKGETLDGYVVEDAGEIQAYCFYRRAESPDAPYGYKLWVSDCQARTHAAARRLLSFFSDHRSMAWQLSLPVPPHDIILASMPEHPYSVDSMEYWMLRIVHVKEALTRRGYAAALNTELHLSVEDPLISGNNGSWKLVVENGVPTVTPGGRGSLRVSERGLASLYAGLSPASWLAMQGLMEGPESDLETATAVFSAPGSPWMVDRF